MQSSTARPTGLLTRGGHRRAATGDGVRADPEQATAAAFELGVFLADDPARLNEAAACFRRVVEIGLAVAVPAALLNLAGVLFRQGRSLEAEQNATGRRG